MIDKTTAGITAEPGEVEAVLNNLCGYHLAERDPVFRYTVLTREQVLYDGLVAAIKRERGRALAELVASGTTMTHAAQLTNLTSRQQVQRLIAIAKAAEAAAAEIQAASGDFGDRLAAATDFENRLAAVEATLDEVVSGIVAPPPDPAVPDPAPEYVEVPEFGPPPQFNAAQFAPDLATAHVTTATEVNTASITTAPHLAPPIVPVAWTGDDPVEAAAISAEATQLLPSLVANSAPESQPAEDTRWWRRHRDSGAA